MDNKIEQPCCRDWETAHQSSTDNEEYGSLVYYTNGPHIGGDRLPAVKFCPWCAAPKQSHD